MKKYIILTIALWLLLFSFYKTFAEDECWTHAYVIKVLKPFTIHNNESNYKTSDIALSSKEHRPDEDEVIYNQRVTLEHRFRHSDYHPWTDYDYWWSPSILVWHWKNYQNDWWLMSEELSVSNQDFGDHMGPCIEVVEYK